MSGDDDAFYNWLAGFADGEGCFYVACDKRYFRHYCAFRIHLRDDDAPVLREIHRRTGLGTINFKKAWGSAKPSCGWVVTSKAGCARLVEVFDAHPLRAKKARDYAIWRQAVEAWPLKDEERMAQYKQALADIRQYQPSGADLFVPRSLDDPWRDDAEAEALIRAVAGAVA